MVRELYRKARQHKIRSAPKGVHFSFPAAMQACLRANGNGKWRAQRDTSDLGLKLPI
jgi:hypothetical protein